MAAPEMKTRENRREKVENYVERFHLKLEDLRVAVQALNNQYLNNTNIPLYPRPEFQATHLKHDTDQKGLEGIREKGGFMDPNAGSLVWFSLVVGPEEIEAAERRLLETTYPDRTEEQIQNQQSFLKKFASSPAFLRSSRYGPYRFTFSVEEVLRAYKDQFCSRAEPVMRVMKTVLYKQEVVYVVLVHRLEDEELYSVYPLLDENPDPVCTYKGGRFIWRSEAMCKAHSFVLVQNDAEKRMEAEAVWADGREEWFVWDHVAIALHVGKQVLKFDPNELREKLTFCEKAPVVVNKRIEFQNLQNAQTVVAELWPDYPSPLMRDGEEAPEVPQED